MSFSFCDTSTSSKIGLCANRFVKKEKKKHINPMSKKHRGVKGGCKDGDGKGLTKSEESGKWKV